jgi:hypothetical protein
LVVIVAGLRAVLDDVLETIADSSMRKRGTSWSIESTVSSADTEFSNTARIGANSAGNADRAIRETSLEKSMVLLFWLAAVILLSVVLQVDLQVCCETGLFDFL